MRYQQQENLKGVIIYDAVSYAIRNPQYEPSSMLT